VRGRRVLALALTGGALAPAVALAGAFPAGAAGLVDYRAYQQTLPYSVITGMGYDTDEETKVTNNTRTGVVGDKTAVPLKTTSGPRVGILGALPVVATLLYIDGQIESTIEFDRDGPKPDRIPQDEWDACAPSGGDDWTGNFFDGLRDWTASFDGVDCNEVREGWTVEKDPNYEPIGAVGVPGTYPQRVGTTFGSDAYYADILAPVWDDRLTPSTGDDPTRKIGWLWPIVNGPFVGGITVTVEAVKADGSVYSSSTTWSSTGSTGYVPGGSGAPAACSTARCYEFSNHTAIPIAQRDAEHLMLRITTARMSGGVNNLGTKSLGVMPYVNPLGGTFSPGLARQVLLTTVFTEEGGVFQCRTASFLETDAFVPRPCEPEVLPGHTPTRRTVEVVPETDTGYVPGSNPTRGVTTTEVPEVVRDWSQDAPAERRYDLRKIGLGSCFDFPDACLDWFEDQDKLNKYECDDGTNVVALSECTKYARLFKPGAITGGTPYPDPGAAPGATPGGQTGSAPGTGTPAGQTVKDPTKTRECFPTGWGIFNPVEWIYKPVKCALEDAFVPRQDFINNTGNNLRLKWLGSSMMGLLSVFETASTMFIDGSGCSGPLVELNAPDLGLVYNGYPMSACSGGVADVASFSYTLSGIVAWVMAIGSIARSVAGVVAFRGIGGEGDG
jgi:hypothetical protein